MTGRRTLLAALAPPPLAGCSGTTAPAGPGPAELSSGATIPGVFGLELHEAGTVLLTLQVP